jgi:hypothetical protein
MRVAVGTQAAAFGAVLAEPGFLYAHPMPAADLERYLPRRAAYSQSMRRRNKTPTTAAATVANKTM